MLRSVCAIAFALLVIPSFGCAQEARLTALERRISILEQEILELRAQLRQQSTPAKPSQPPAQPTRTFVPPSSFDPYPSRSVREVVPPRYAEPTFDGRCQAITLKGTQCKRMAQSGRKFCWQH